MDFLTYGGDGVEANKDCLMCGGTGHRHNGYFQYPCTCTHPKFIGINTADVTFKGKMPQKEQT